MQCARLGMYQFRFPAILRLSKLNSMGKRVKESGEDNYFELEVFGTRKYSRVRERGREREEGKGRGEGRREEGKKRKKEKKVNEKKGGVAIVPG